MIAETGQSEFSLVLLLNTLLERQGKYFFKGHPTSGSVAVNHT